MDKQAIKAGQVITITTPQLNEGQPIMVKVLMFCEDTQDLGFGDMADATTFEAIPSNFKLHQVLKGDFELVEIHTPRNTDPYVN